MDPKVKVRILVVLMFLLTAVRQIRSVRFKRCDLAHRLRKYGLDLGEIANWLCLVHGESSYRTDAIGSSINYGLFQFNSQYWCKKPGRWSANVCRKSCSEFLDSNIDDDFVCAKKVHSIHGFSAWTAWKTRCQNRFKTKQYLIGCF
ncbi:Uncharacterised protein g2844 [Pycnogonum litorale]